LQTVSKAEFEDLLNVFLEFWDIQSEEYHNMYVKNVIFLYKVLPVDTTVKKIKINPHVKVKQAEKTSFKYQGYALANTMDFTQWGDTHFYANYHKAIVYKYKSKIEYHIEIYESYTKVDLVVGNKIILSFKDIPIYNRSIDFSSYIRKFKNQSYIIENGKLKLKCIKRKTRFIKSIKPSLTLKDNFITMDLETRNINGTLSVYLVSIYDGQNLTSFYLSDYKDSAELLTNAILSIMKRKYDGYRVYLHNFSYFDGIFLLKILCQLTDKIIPIINDNQLIEIRFYFARMILKFRDSLLLLPSSLENLAKSFEVTNKEIFPVLFLNDSNIDLNYKGEVPPIKTFVNIDEVNYNKYKKSFANKIWDLKEEAIKYCNQDVVTLHQIIKKFANLIFDEVRLDIAKYPTISSLALGIFRVKFLKKGFEIPILSGKLFDFIAKSYTGGNVDVYKPSGKNLFHYDVNSLYPSNMYLNFMPVAEPIYFEGDISKYHENAFGFFEVFVDCPNNLNIPLLQNRLKIDNSRKTITPVGTWTGTYFSEELKKANQLNYKFEITRGFLFKKKNIFKDFVEFFYAMKEKNEKNSAYYIIAKLILNSLYGRFGMDPNKEKHVIINSLDSEEIFKNFTVTNVINFNDKELISYLDSSMDENEDELSTFMNISVPIASAVTSYGRIFMIDYKNIPGNTCYYTDTDSLDLEKELPTEKVGRGLGQFKLEYKSEKSIFLAPKLYFSNTNIGEICKMKGFKFNNNQLKNVITFEDFEHLLYKNNKVVLSQDKWKRNLGEGFISIENEPYTLKTTLGKRKLLFNDFNRFIDTKPLELKNGELVKSNETN